MFSNNIKGGDEIKKIKPRFPRSLKEKKITEETIKVKMQEKLGNIFIQILHVLKMYTLWRQIGKAFQKTCIAYKLCTKK